MLRTFCFKGQLFGISVFPNNHKKLDSYFESVSPLTVCFQTLCSSLDNFDFNLWVLTSALSTEEPFVTFRGWWSQESNISASICQITFFKWKLKIPPYSPVDTLCRPYLLNLLLYCSFPDYA